MTGDDDQDRELGPRVRLLAALIAVAGAWAVLDGIRQPEPADLRAVLSWKSLSQLCALWATALLARAALSGRDFRPARRPSEPATPDQLQRLRWLGAEIPRRLGRHRAGRLIASLESRLPATPAQQLALARHGNPRGVFTRASAERFLRERAAEELFYRQHDWAADWYEAGLAIRAPEELDPALMEAFDQAWGALAAQGLRYPLPPYIWSWKLRDPVERLQMASDFLTDAAGVQPPLVRARVLRRPLDGAELRQLFPAYVNLLAQVGEGFLVDLGEDPSPAELLFLAALHATRPALLLDTALGWAAAAEVRREIAAEAEQRAADAAIEWDEG
jgi:hypothetical protein